MARKKKPEIIDDQATETIIEGSGEITPLSLIDTKTPEVWFAGRQNFLMTSRPIDVIRAFCLDFDISPIPLACDLYLLDPLSRPYEICVKLFQTKR